MNQNIAGCSKIIYVFDIQDFDRYNLALKYFESMIDLIKDNKEAKNIEISIFFHKADPDLSQTHPEITEMAIDNLKEKIKDIVDKTDIFYQIFKTSIYAIFEKLIID